MEVCRGKLSYLPSTDSLHHLEISSYSCTMVYVTRCLLCLRSLVIQSETGIQAMVRIWSVQRFARATESAVKTEELILKFATVETAPVVFGPTAALSVRLTGNMAVQKNSLLPLRYHSQCLVQGLSVWSWLAVDSHVVVESCRESMRSALEDVA